MGITNTSISTTKPFLGSGRCCWAHSERSGLLGEGSNRCTILMKLGWICPLCSKKMKSGRKTANINIKQVALLSQRGRALLRVIEYFAKSYQNHSKWHCWVGRIGKSLLVFHWKYVCISYCFWDIQRQRIMWPWNRR